MARRFDPDTAVFWELEKYDEGRRDPVTREWVHPTGQWGKTKWVESDYVGTEWSHASYWPAKYPAVEHPLTKATLPIRFKHGLPEEIYRVEFEEKPNRWDEAAWNAGCEIYDLVYANKHHWSRELQWRVRCTWRVALPGSPIRYDQEVMMKPPVPRHPGGFGGNEDWPHPTYPGGWTHPVYSLWPMQHLFRPYELSDDGIDAAEDEWFRTEGYSRSARDAVHAAVMAAQTALLRYEIAEKGGPGRDARNEMLEILSLGDHVAAWEACVHQATHAQKVKAQRPDHRYDLFDDYEAMCQIPPGLEEKIAKVIDLATPELIRDVHNIGMKVMPAIGSRIAGHDARLHGLKFTASDGSNNVELVLKPEFDRNTYAYTAELDPSLTEARVEFEVVDEAAVATAKFKGVDVPVTRHIGNIGFRFGDPNMKLVGKVRGLTGVMGGDQLAITVTSENGVSVRVYTVDLVAAAA